MIKRNILTCILLAAAAFLYSCSGSTSVTKKSGGYTAPEGKISHEQYVEMFKDMAIKNMHEKGVPASITLAQGILESGGGNSWLAKTANNHFGIKCGGDWKGPSVKHDDNKKGECFRKYDSPLGSFEDHAEFLRGRKWYAHLFKLEITDYKGWAYGLKQAGYATDPRYPKKLIEIIERYGLQNFDKK